MIKLLGKWVKLLRNENTAYHGTGDNCIGTAWYVWDDHQSTCEDGLRCFAKYGWKAEEDEAGKCFIDLEKRCFQTRPGDGSSGGCNPPFNCRAYRKWSQYMDTNHHNFGAVGGP